MGMIRRADIQQTAREALVLNLGDIAKEGERVVAQARAEAERIVAEAKTERERLIAGAAEQGHKEGLERGLTEGRAQGLAEGTKAAMESRRTELGVIERAWSDTVDRVESSRQEMLAALRHDALALAIGIAERVTRESIRHDPETVVRAMEAALALLARPTRLVVKINPEDEALVRESLAGLMAKFRDATHAELVIDNAIERGGCVLCTDSGGSIDATIRTQIERLAAALMGEVDKPAEAARQEDASARSVPAPSPASAKRSAA